MAKLLSPSISITFVEKAASLIERGSRGIVALVLRDASVSSTPKSYTIRDVFNIPTELSETNAGYIKDCLIGYSKAPLKVIVYVMPVKGEQDTQLYADMMEYLETEVFQWLAIPTVETDGKTADIISWVKTQRQNDIMVKAVLPNADAADCEGIINWTSSFYHVKTADGKSTVQECTPEQCTPRIAGLLAGILLPLSRRQPA